jgi:hypothetical protein
MQFPRTGPAPALLQARRGPLEHAVAERTHPGKRGAVGRSAPRRYKRQEAEECDSGDEGGTPQAAPHALAPRLRVKTATIADVRSPMTGAKMVAWTT